MIELLLGAERLLAEGDADRAEHLFAQVAEADPRNAIAVVGLARVARARGDIRAALEMARRALAIDPEDVAGRQLAEELANLVEPDRTAADGPGAHGHGAEPRRSIFARLKALLGFGG